VGRDPGDELLLYSRVAHKVPSKDLCGRLARDIVVSGPEAARDHNERPVGDKAAQNAGDHIAVVGYRDHLAYVVPRVNERKGDLGAVRIQPVPRRQLGAHGHHRCGFEVRHGHPARFHGPVRMSRAW